MVCSAIYSRLSVHRLRIAFVTAVLLVVIAYSAFEFNCSPGGPSIFDLRLNGDPSANSKQATLMEFEDAEGISRKLPQNETSGLMPAFVNSLAVPRETPVSPRWFEILSSYVESANFGKLVRRPAPDERFLYGIPVYGPNNQYYSFIQAIKLAVALNRTLVLPFFRAHYLHIVGAAGADHQYEVEHSFDLIALSNAPTAPRMIRFADFLEYWEDRVVDVLWMSGTADTAASTWRVYQRALGVSSIRHILNATSDPDHLPYSCNAREISATLRREHQSSRFIVLAYCFRNVGTGAYQLSSSTMIHYGLRLRDEHLRAVRMLIHAPSIRNAAELFLLRAFGGRPYIALHWRKADNASAPPDCTKRKACVDSVSLDTLLDALDGIVLAAWGIRGPDDSPPTEWPIYMASVRFSDEDAAIVTSRGYNEIVRYDDSPSLTDAAGNYYFSLLEQEICMRAAAFVGSESTWSDRILEYRVATPGLRMSIMADAGMPSFAGVDLVANSSVGCGFEYMSISDETPRNMTIACANNQPISDILFASFGNPRGYCPWFEENPLCSTPAARSIVAAACVGRTRCDIPVSNAPEHFSLECRGVGYALAVLVECAMPG